ncbi:MAG: hypothetical protein ACJA0G_002188 [Kangiellaceae bacterium]|jgi:hypothetical protein
MQKQLTYLLLVFVILCSGIYYIGVQDSKLKTSSGDIGLTKLMKQVNVSAGTTNGGINTNTSIRNIQLITADSVLLDAKFENTQWIGFIDGSETGFPLQKSHLATLVRDLTDADIVEYKSAKPKNHARLGLLALNADNSTATLVKVTTDVSSFELLLGYRAMLNNSQFVRFNDNNQMLLIDKLIDLPDDNFAWLEKSLFNITADTVTSIERTHGDKTLWGLQNITSATQERIKNSMKTTVESHNPETFNGQRFAFSALTLDEELVYPLVIDNFVSSLLGLTFESLLTLDTIERGAYQLLTRFTIQTFNNETVEVDVFSNSSAQDEANVSNFTTVPYIVKINALKRGDYLHQWLFVIPTYQLDAILKDRADFVTKTPAD